MSCTDDGGGGERCMCVCTAAQAAASEKLRRCCEDGDDQCTVRTSQLLTLGHIYDIALARRSASPPALRQLRESGSSVRLDNSSHRTLLQSYLGDVLAPVWLRREGRRGRRGQTRSHVLVCDEHLRLLREPASYAPLPQRRRRRRPRPTAAAALASRRQAERRARPPGAGQPAGVRSEGRLRRLALPPAGGAVRGAPPPHAAPGSADSGVAAAGGAAGEGARAGRQHGGHPREDAGGRRPGGTGTHNKNNARSVRAAAAAAGGGQDRGGEAGVDRLAEGGQGYRQAPGGGDAPPAGARLAPAPVQALVLCRCPVVPREGYQTSSFYWSMLRSRMRFWSCCQDQSASDVSFLFLYLHFLFLYGFTTI